MNAQTVTGTVTSGTTSSPMRQELTDAQKTILDQAKVLFDAGKQDEAKALLTASGINFPPGGKAHGRGEKKGNMREIDAAIASGNFATFQTLASTSPLASITQATFNLLTPEFLAKQNAEKNIQTILTNSGIQMPQHRGPPISTTTTQ